MLADGVGRPPVGAGPPRPPARALGRPRPAGPRKGEEIPLPMRIVHVATDAALQRLLGGEEYAARRVRERAGQALRPGGRRLTRRRRRRGSSPSTATRRPGTRLSRCEPQPRLVLEGDAIDRALAAMAGFTDLISPYLAGHSAGVAELASAAARRCRIDAGGCGGDSAGGFRARPRPCRGRRAHLAKARAAYGRRMGAGAPAPLPHGACPLPLAVPLGARPDRGCPPRASRRLRLPPRFSGR